MKTFRDKKERRAVTLTDLSKTFDYICYSLHIAKLKAYGFDRSFSAYLDIIYGALQGSILGPLLFNIILCDFF